MQSAVTVNEVRDDSLVERQREAAREHGIEPFFSDQLPDGSEAPALAVIPPGGFWMGSRPDEHGAKECEQPRHEVRVPRAFAITRGAIRRREYDLFLNATGHRRPRPYSWNDPDYPVFNVTAGDAEAYAEWLGE
jgi:formylglycine-generating enzyme required for sulfatase activity